MEIIRPKVPTGKRSPQLVHDWRQENNRFYLECPDTVLEVTVVAPDILRFRYSPEGHFEADFSYALPDASLPDEVEGAYLLEEVDDQYHIKTDLLTCKISRTLHSAIFDRDGNLLCEDERGYHWEPHPQYGGNIVYCSKKIQEQECYFGLGDKPNVLNLKGMRFENWGSDTYGFERTTDPLYKNIPFFMGLHHGRAYGMFFDNTFKTRFDFGHERADVCSFWAKGGEMNYYFIYGPELRQVAARYTFLTGRPELPPRWSLGFHQSKWSYHPESTVHEIADRFIEEKIPCDALHIDIDYMDGFRCFTWDNNRFPDPKGMVEALEQKGMKTVVIIDPGIKIDPNYVVYQQAREKGYFCRRCDGPLMKGAVWPGPCHFPDFTHPEVRSWWSGLFKEFMECGIHGIWNDMNEPALMDIGTFPYDTRHFYDGRPCSHRKAHNVYGMQMARATYHGMKSAIFPRRPFALTRSGYAGVQRYAAVWTGDNLSTWEHLWIANIQCQRLSISGLSFCGSDVGGFIGKANGELLTRWVQMAVFHPFFRIHSSGEYGDQEPWAFGEPYTSAMRSAIELRYRLMSYLYTTFFQHVKTGGPMILPLSFMDQHDPETYFRMEEFGFGDHLLVCPIARSGADGRQVYLPQGNWYHYFSQQMYSGKQEVWVDSSLADFPLFVRAGALIPHDPVMAYVGADPVKTLELQVFVDPTGQVCFSELYEDAGEFYDYEQGNYTLRRFSVQHQPESLIILQEREGRFNAEYTEFRFVVYGLDFIPAGYELDGEIVSFSEVDTELSGPIQFTIEKNFTTLRLLSFGALSQT